VGSTVLTDVRNRWPQSGPCAKNGCSSLLCAVSEGYDAVYSVRSRWIGHPGLEQRWVCSQRIRDPPPRGPSNGPTGRRSFRQMLHSLRPLRSRIAAFWPHASRRLPLGLAGQVRGPRSLAAPASWPYRRGITEPVCCSWPTRAAHSLESSCAHSRADQPGSIRNPVPSPQGRWCIRASCAITSENQSGEPASRLSGGTLSGLELAAPPLWVEYASQQVTRMSLLARVVPLQP
jgi:hypothetical protein